MNWEFRRLQLKDEGTFRAALAAWVPDPSFMFAASWDEKENDFPKYLQLLAAQEKGRQLQPGWVPASAFFAFVNEEIVGRVNFRHELNDFLLKIGGHIGYGVLPQHRRKGYASRMLAETLPKARKLGLDKVLVTCDDDNAGSIRTIESNGGIFENKVEQDGRAPKRRYWITL